MADGAKVHWNVNSQIENSSNKWRRPKPMNWIKRLCCLQSSVPHVESKKQLSSNLIYISQFVYNFPIFGCWFSASTSARESNQYWIQPLADTGGFVYLPTHQVKLQRFKTAQQCIYSNMPSIRYITVMWGTILKPKLSDEMRRNVLYRKIWSEIWCQASHIYRSFS